jgi:DNA-directed RNA polymerase sigma subunit (sigma70/sigma32)
MLEFSRNLKRDMTNNKEHVANKNIDLESIVKVLFAGLTDRETGVVSGRYALDGGGRIKTLEEIGKHYGVTRERIRQVENATIKKLKNSEVLGKVIEPVKNAIRNLLLEYGGVMHEQYPC